MKVRAALAEATRRLAAVPGNPRQDAELLMAHALAADISALHLRHLDDQAPEGWESLVRRRLEREPVAYIIGRAGFWTIEMEVGPGVLIPRADSETLIEAAVAHHGATGPARILDLGTGPGTLLLAALDQWRHARGVGVDASERALDFAARNADRLGLASRVDWRLGDWGDGVADAFDLVLCNPPYVEAAAAVLDADVTEWEPRGALFAGEDGLDAYRRIAPQLSRLVAPGGIACLEVGFGQADAVAALFAGSPFTITSRDDLRGIKRCLVLTH